MVRTGTYEDDNGTHSYDYILVAQADGSASRYLTEGSQPAWKPHP